MRKLLLILMLCSVAKGQWFGREPLLGEQVYHNHPLAQGLEGLWLLNEGSGTKVADLSGDGNDGTLYNNTSWSYSRYGYALNFDGTADYIRAPKTKNIFGGDLSVSFWFSFNAAPTGFDRLVTYYYDATNYIQVTVGATNDLAVSGKYGSATERALEIDNAAWYTISTWVHICVVWDSSALSYRFYVNGMEEGSIATSGWGIGTETGLTLAIRNTLATNDFNGRFDDVRIWSRGLTTLEVESLYRNPYQIFQVEEQPLYVAAAAASSGSQFIYISSIPGLFILVIAGSFCLFERNSHQRG